MLGDFIPPRDSRESALVDLWSHFFDADRIGVRDDFFDDLGGHSILAAEMLDAVEQRFDQRVPLATMAERSTIETLAELLRENAVETPWDGIAPIQTQGEKIPLFWVFGSIPKLRYLADQLGASRPLYGIQWKGADGHRAASSIEEMADYGLERLRTVQPEGPYLLGGLCLGGLIAYEMAQRIHQSGEEVRHLIMMDTPTRHTSAYHVGLPLKLRQLVQDIKHEGFRPALYQFIERIRESVTYLRTTLSVRTRIGLWWHRLTSDKMPPRYREIDANFSMQKATAGYTPEPYEGPITIFRSKEDYLIGFLGYWSDEAMGWSPLLPPDTEIHQIPCQHAHLYVYPESIDQIKRIISS
jgi:aspartate racemase